MTMEIFSARVTRELGTVDLKKIEEIFVKVGKNEIKMHANNVERPVWKCKIPQNEIFGKEVLIPTEKGDTVGKVIYFGIINDGAIFEKSVIVEVQSSGTIFEALSSSVKIPSLADIKKMENDKDMAISLSTVVAVDKDKQKNKLIKDPKTVEKLLSIAKNYNVTIAESGATYKITGNNENKIYLFKNYLRVDLSGFNIENVLVKKISDIEARDNHLGKVRGQILFILNNINSSVNVFETCLKQLIKV